MTQPPLGTNQGGSGPFDEAGPGQPDVPTSGFPAGRPSGTTTYRPVRPRRDPQIRRSDLPPPATVPGDNYDNTSSGTAVEGRHREG